MQDSNAERRNLTVLSAIIVIYYLAGGTIDPSHLKLGLVEMTFSNPFVLTLSLWVALAWFFYRHFVVNYSNFRSDFNKELRTLFVNWIAKLTIMKTSSFIDKHDSTEHSKFGGYVFIDLDKIKYDLVCYAMSADGERKDTIDLTNHQTILFIFKWLTFTFAASKKPAALGFWLAPLLALTAFTLAIYNRFI